MAERWDKSSGVYLYLNDHKITVERCAEKHGLTKSDVVRRCINYLHAVGELDDAIERYEVTR